MGQSSERVKERTFPMLSEKIFAFAQVADQVVLWILIVLSVISIGMILERYFALFKVSSESGRIREKVKAALQSNSVEDVESISKDITSLEGRAASYALKHMRDGGSRGVGGG